MQMETKSLARTGAIAAVTFVVTAYILGSYWPFAIIVSLIVGYFAYEFRETLVAIPSALEAAKAETLQALTEKYGVVRKYFSEPHVFTYIATAITIGLAAWPFDNINFSMLVRGCFVSEHYANGYHAYGSIEKIVYFLISVAFAIVMLSMTMVITRIVLYILAFIGARAADKAYWTPFAMEDNIADESAKLNLKGYHEEPLTYGNVMWWAAEGIGVIILFFIFLWWFWVLRGMLGVAWEMLKVGWHLAVIIHSENRMVASLYGTLGGLASWIIFRGRIESPTMLAACITTAALLGAAFAVGGKQLIAQRFASTPGKI